MKDLYNWFKTIDQLSISIAIILELLCSVLKEVEDGFGRVAVLECLGGRMCYEVYFCLLGIVRQCGIKNGLEVGRGGLW